jgi:hypothetical protein
MDLKPGSLVLLQTTFKKLHFSRKQLVEEYFSPKMPYLNYTFLSAELDFTLRVARFLWPDVLAYSVPLKRFMKGKKCNFIAALDAQHPRCYKENRNIKRQRWHTQQWSSHKKSLQVDNIELKYFPLYQENGLFSVSVLEAFLMRAVSRGLVPILVEYPVDPSEYVLTEKVRNTTDYMRHIARLKKYAPYYDLIHMEGISASDFGDNHHPLDKGKIKITSRIMEIIAGNL